MNRTFEVELLRHVVETAFITLEVDSRAGDLEIHDMAVAMANGKGSWRMQEILVSVKDTYITDTTEDEG